MKSVLAFDLGASSATGIVVTLNDNLIEYEEVVRFEGYTVEKDEHLFWDFPHIVDQIISGIKKVEKNYKIESIAFDTWGVDFGLIDKNGELLENPYHYRDKLTNGVIEKIKQNVDLFELFSSTGIQPMEINSLFQLIEIKEQRPDLYAEAKHLLFMPDLLNFFFTDQKLSERTIASTSQIFNPRIKDWDFDLLEKFELKSNLFSKVIEPGTVIGKIKKDISDKYGIKQHNIISVGSHDTASAIICSRKKNKNVMFLSSGTWSLLGTEIEKPALSKQAFMNELSNEGGVSPGIKLLKNITGLWLIQEARRYYRERGMNYSFDDIASLAEEAKLIDLFFDTDLPQLQKPGNIPEKIVNYGQKTGQEIPKTEGELFRSIYENLAFKYYSAYQDITEVISTNFDLIRIVGGGSRAKILNQFTSNVIGLKTESGFPEATALGNGVIQLIALGYISDLDEASSILNNSFEVNVFEPEDTELWQQRYNEYKSIIR